MSEDMFGAIKRAEEELKALKSQADKDIERAKEELEKLRSQAAKTKKSDLEKAHYAAAIFAKVAYLNCSVWLVEEVSSTYTQHGQYPSEAEEKAAIIKPGRRDRVRYRVTDDRLFKTFDPATAYLLARSLERGD